MDLIKTKDTKFSFLGIALSGISTAESAIAFIDRDAHIVMLDKLFSVADIKYYLDNFAGKQNAIILVSVPENEIMLSSKWKYNSRTYDLVNFDTQMLNLEDWTNRFSSRGSEYFKTLSESGIDIYRFDIENMKKVFGNAYSYRERTPADCKSLQDTLRMKYKMYELPVNMLPATQIEALLGAILARMLVVKSREFECGVIGSFDKLPVVGVIPH